MKRIFLTIISVITITAQGHADKHGIAMHGAPKYQQNQSFDYVNANAPVGGTIRMGLVGTFDSYNPFVTKGTVPSGLSLLTDTLVFERLMFRSLDEPFSLYGWIAGSVEMADDRSWIEFTLRPEAKWADGQPITTEDVAFSYQTLKEKGRPNLRLYYNKVKEMTITGPGKIKFTFNPLPDEEGYDPELPMLIALMSILPKHLWQDKDFEKLGLKDMVGSGPYKIKESDPGRTITYERRPDYWGWKLPMLKGYYNFNTITFDYYRNQTVSLEAFKAGEYDIHTESDPNLWLHEYNFPGVKDGKVVKHELETRLPVGFKAFVFNTRNPLFADRKVRWALAHAFDFEWMNRTLFQNAYTRTRSYFENTELASTGALSEDEKTMLGDLCQKFPAEATTAAYSPPSSADRKALRDNINQARKLLEEAGWVIKNGKCVNAKTGEPFKFEILLYLPEDEKLALALSRNLKQLGIDARVRVADPSQYERRRMDFDYDMIINTWGYSLSPGREQSYYWSTKAADEPGSRNYAGVRDPLVDHLCDVLATAKDRKTLVTAAHALDRALLWGHYVIPLFHMNKTNLAYWDKFGHPEFRPDTPAPYILWWSKNEKRQDN